jgi:hypothetical protein
MKFMTMKLVIMSAAFVMASSIGLGQTSGTPDQIEEDWKVVIASPSPIEVGPQLTTCMSPVSDGSTPFVAFDLNYRDTPSYQAGGLQVKVYSNDDVQSSTSQGDAVCQTANETISWTQRMSFSGNKITYAIVIGQSTTWGQFGQAQSLGPVSFTSSIASLASYSADTSVAKSGAGWQSNRVATMALVCVRYYKGGQLVSTDNKLRSVISSSNGG